MLDKAARTGSSFWWWMWNLGHLAGMLALASVGLWLDLTSGRGQYFFFAPDFFRVTGGTAAASGTSR